MSENNIIEYLTLTQKYILLLLRANENQPIRGKLWFQKELFLVAENISRLSEETEYESDLMGPYSENADAELEQLQNEGLVEVNGKIKLNRLGELIAKQIEEMASQETKEIMSDMKAFLNDLSKDELLGFIYFSYPDMTVESIVFEDIKPKREEIGLGLYKKQKVSLGKAAMISGISQEDFIKKAQENGMKIFPSD